MDITKFYPDENEKPLDNLVSNGGMCSILRTIACVGDSLSSGEFESQINGEHGYHDMYDYSWGQFLARDAGCTVYNFSKGGMGACPYCQHFANNKDLWNPEKRANAYIIALGVNDMNSVNKGLIEFGEISDIDLGDYNKNKETFIGCYAKIIQRYKEISPGAKFFLMTMPRGKRGADMDALYVKHAETLYKFAEIFDNTYIIDLRKYAPVYDNEFKKNFYLGGHLSPAGYRLTAIMVESYIDYIIRNNPKDFKQIGFMWTELYNETEN